MQAEDPAERRVPRHDAYEALRSPNYRRFASGFLVSSTGLQMLSTALGWEVYARTHDPMNLGYIGLARALPVVALALPAGHVLDRMSRRRVLVATQVLMGLAAGALALVSHAQAPIWLVYVVIALMGCARVFNGPSRATLLPSIVPVGVFGNAVTWNSGVFQVSAVGGPLIAGLVIDHVGLAWPVYAATAGGCWLFAALAVTLRPRPQERPPDATTGRGMTAGLSHLWREKNILAAITLDLFAVLLGGATALFPIYARTLEVAWIGEGSRLGLLRAAQFAGATVMAGVMAHRPPFRRAGATLLWSVAGFGLCIVVFGLSRSFWLSLAVLVLAGALDNVSVVVRHVLVQLRTPDYLRGRVSSVNSVFIECSNELGGFESGVVAKLFGATASVVSGGVGTILVVLGVAWAIPQVRRLSLEERGKDPPAPPDSGGPHKTSDEVSEPRRAAAGGGAPP